MKQVSIAAVLATALFASTSFAAQDGQLNRSTGTFVSLSAGGLGVAFDGNGLTRADGEEEGAGSGGQKLSVGHWFSENWGVEGSFVRGSEFSQRFTAGTFKGQAESFGVAGLGRLPLGDRWALLGRLGLSTTKIKDKGSTAGVAQFDEFSGRSTSLTLGFEADYHLTKNAVLFLELEGRGAAGENSSVGYGGLGLRWAF